MAHEQPSVGQQESSPLQEYLAAKQDIKLAMGVLAGGEVLLGLAYKHINSMERHAQAQAQKVLAQYTADMQTGVKFPLEGSEVVTTRAAHYGLTYQANLEEGMTPEVNTVAAHVFNAVDANEGLKQVFEGFVESELMLRLGDEVVETATDLAETSPVIRTGRQIHDTLQQNIPLSEDHFVELSKLLGHGMHTAMSATGLALLEPAIKHISAALKKSPAALEAVITNEFSQVISFDPTRNLGSKALDAQIRAMVAGLNNEEVNTLIANPEFNWSQLGTVLAADYVLRHGQELFARDGEGHAHTPDNLRRIATAVELIGSLNEHQTQHKLQSQTA